MAIIKNQFKLLGRVGKYSKDKPVDIKFYDNGKCATKIRLGVKTGAEKWDNYFITFWNTDQKPLAEMVAENLREGDYVQIIGRLKMQEFTPESMQGQVDENGRPKTVQRLDLVGLKYNRVKYNEETEDFEIIEG